MLTSFRATRKADRDTAPVPALPNLPRSGNHTTGTHKTVVKQHATIGTLTGAGSACVAAQASWRRRRRFGRRGSRGSDRLGGVVGAEGNG